VQRQQVMLTLKVERSEKTDAGRGRWRKWASRQQRCLPRVAGNSALVADGSNRDGLQPARHG